MIKILFDSETPIYIQLKNEIIKAIARGELEDGEALPSIRDLSVDIGVNLHTINKAYNLLKDDGYLSIDRRKGAMVNVNKDNKKDFLNSIDEEIEVFLCRCICKGVSKEEIIKLISDKYDDIK
ncbi:MAG: GntR family transcriptional regulator [Clostridium argentinense]|uniref:GntR family transcriptional regulator n=1 Tax=Clostridium faecium TaxID=2762223 RepID=A0ABR8YPY5_9CLOT|nr:GntR family transcriptional regulator [Clostridium faecium]MBD8046305.1 GntR family transcriptional regulator [Clostridium faecium]MBS5825122.1 GntR family transcriptional regulator [Clostridium argentinense]MDU1349466.1 GntR family transcriptional regulator [Clostridium argentinense]